MADPEEGSALKTDVMAPTGAPLVFLSQEDVVEAGGLEMRPTIEVVERVLALHALGQTILPPKASIRWGSGLGSEEVDGRIIAMPAYVGGEFDVAGFKWIPSVPSNPARGLPRGVGVILLSDRTTGLPLAVMDGTVVSAVRTGAVTGVACRHLAVPGSSVVGLLGAGVQARTQLMALEVTLPLEQVRVWDISPERADAFCRREARDGYELLPVDTAEAACRGAHVVVPVTLAPEPYVPPEWLAPGCLFASVSSLDPTVELMAQADVVVTDSWAHETDIPSRPLGRALAAGAVDRERVAELGDIVVGAHPGRTSPDQVVFFSPVGLGIEDVAAGHRVYRRAVDAGIGTPLHLWRAPIWS